MPPAVATALALIAAVCLSAASTAAPMARIEGIEDRSLRAGLAEALGEADPAEDRFRARERAQDAAERARLWLESQGYYAAVVDPRLDEAQRPVIRVRPGPQFTFGSVEVVFDQPAGAPPPEPEARRALGLAVGDPITARGVIDARARVLAELRSSGYPDAAEGDHEIIVDHAVDQAFADFLFRTGDFIRFGDPEFAGGLAELDPEYIDRLAPYEIGEPASRPALAEFASRLQGLEAIAVADARLAPAGVEDENGYRLVDVRADPAPRHRLEGIASYSTDEGIGAEIAWTRRNLFGQAELLTLAGQLAELERSVSAEFVAPHWRQYGQELTLFAEAAQERTDAFDQDVVRTSATLTRQVTERISASAGVEFSTAEIRDARGERRLNTLSAPIGAAYDGRDDPLDPRNGVFVDLAAEPGWSFGDNDVRFVRLVGGLRGYRGVSDKIVLAGRVRVGTLQGASAFRVGVDERFYAGGGGSVRGYAYQSLSPFRPSPITNVLEPFGGAALAEVSGEVRYRYNERFGAVVFVDGGAATEDSQPDFGAMRYGAGLGLRYYPGFGPLRVDIATPLDPRERDDVVQVYISIGQSF
ncbi:MAG: autotransporter assembly complex family protein [Oceanicaulis sp.]